MTPPQDWLALPQPAALRLSGPDATRYLNGQITQDVRQLDNRLIHACVTDAKGRLQALIDVLQAPDQSLWILGPSEMADTLAARLSRYLIADDAEIEPLPAVFGYHHFAPWDQPPAPPSENGTLHRSHRFGTQAWEWWTHSPLSLTSADPQLADFAEDLRIRSGIGTWNKDIFPDSLPPESRLEDRTISYHKGCYIGQEVLSRMKTAGKTNRLLTRFLATNPTTTPCPIFMGDTEVGELTSVSPLATTGNRFHALGILKKAAFDQATLGLTRHGSQLTVLRDHPATS